MATSKLLLSRTFVQLADSLVDDFDIIELLTLLSRRCVELFDAGAAGILLGDQRGALRVVAASSEQARLLELFQLQNNQGPCLECYSSGQWVASGALEVDGRWPQFSARALAAGFHSVHAFPLRLREEVIGTLNIFMENFVVFPDEDLLLCQALADVATIAILQNQAAREAHNVNVQLQRALDTRVAIEQAKGVVAERERIDMATAFAVLRRYARDKNLQLGDVASSIVEGTLTPSEMERPVEIDPDGTASA